MNAAARALSQGNIFRGDLMSMSVSKKSGLFFILWVLVITSALGIIYLRHVERQIFNESQILSRQLNQVQLERGQLLLEQSMWTSPSRIQKLAEQQLNMQSARPEALIVIKRAGRTVSEEEGGASSQTVIHHPSLMK